MARSGSYNYGRTANQIINGALRLIGAYDRGQTPDASDTAEALEALEIMVKAWQGQGLHLWKQKEATLFVQNGTRSYLIGPTGDNATASYVETALAADAAAGDATITVDSISGISNADYLGIVLDDDTIQWTTVNGAPSGTTVTPAAVLTGAASTDNKVYAYTTKIQRPLRILSIRREDLDGNEVELELVSRDEYFELPNKANEGTPTQAYYDPQLDNGKLYFWVVPENVDNVFNLTYLEPIQDFDSTSNDPDFPTEWLEALKYNLAVRLCPEYGVDTAKFQMIKSEAAEYLAAMMMFDNEPESFFVGPDYRGH